MAKPPEQQNAAYDREQDKICPPDRKPAAGRLLKRPTTEEANAGFLCNTGPTMGTQALTSVAPLGVVGLLHVLRNFNISGPFVQIGLAPFPICPEQPNYRRQRGD